MTVGVELMQCYLGLVVPKQVQGAYPYDQGMNTNVQMHINVYTSIYYITKFLRVREKYKSQTGKMFNAFHITVGASSGVV